MFSQHGMRLRMIAIVKRCHDGLMFRVKSHFALWSHAARVQYPPLGLLAHFGEHSRHGDRRLIVRGHRDRVMGRRIPSLKLGKCGR